MKELYLTYTTNYINVYNAAAYNFFHEKKIEEDKRGIEKPTSLPLE